MAISPRNTRTDAQLLAEFPNAFLRKRGARNANGAYGPVSYRAMQDALATLRTQNIQARSRVMDVGGFQPSNPSSANTIALYRIDYTAGTIRVNEAQKYFAAGTDVQFLGTPTITSYDLDGTTMTALSEDGKTYWFTIVAIDVNGAVELRGIAGAEADDGSEAAVTDAQIKACLEAASIANIRTLTYVRVCDIKIQRVETDTITLTHKNVLTDDTLSAARQLGAAWDAVS